VDYKRYGGEPQPDDENLVVMLNPSDSVSYNFKNDFDALKVEIKCYGDGAIMVDVQNTIFYRRVTGVTTLVLNVPMMHIEKQIETLKITCDSGTLYLDTLTLLKGDAHESHTDAL
jgi:hypothetical protein